MCACKDRACVDLVHSDLTAWVDQQIKASGSAATLFAPADKRESEDLLRDAFACADAVVDKSDPPKLLMATAMIGTARDKARERKVRLAATWIEARYTKSDGALDPTFGELRVEFRAPPPGVDDPTRPLGAPVREHSAESADVDCPTWTFVAKTAEWTAETGSCMPTVALAPKCTVEQIWARAIADGAPKEALATLSLGVRKGEPAIVWAFRIEDRPRQINIDKRYADDCAAAKSP
jgi:hypothetical protein